MCFKDALEQQRDLDCLATLRNGKFYKRKKKIERFENCVFIPH
jgi:hypothetical protein